MSEPEQPAPRKPVEELTDEELFAEIREHVTRSRNERTYDRQRFRSVMAETKQRGWNFRLPSNEPGSCPQ